MNSCHHHINEHKIMIKVLADFIITGSRLLSYPFGLDIVVKVFIRLSCVSISLVYLFLKTFEIAKLFLAPSCSVLRYSNCLVPEEHGNSGVE